MTRAARATAITLIAILGLPLQARAGGMFEEHEFFFGTMSQAKAPVNAHLVWYDLFGGTSEESASAKVDLDATLLGWRGGSWSTKNPRFGIGMEVFYLRINPGDDRAGVDALGSALSGICRFNRPSGWIQPYFGMGLGIEIGTVHVDLTPEVSRNAEGEFTKLAFDFRAGVLFRLAEKMGLYVEARELAQTFEGQTDAIFSDDSARVRVSAPVILGGVSFRK